MTCRLYLLIENVWYLKLTRKGLYCLCVVCKQSESKITVKITFWYKVQRLVFTKRKLINFEVVDHYFDASAALIFD